MPSLENIVGSVTLCLSIFLLLLLTLFMSTRTRMSLQRLDSQGIGCSCKNRSSNGIMWYELLCSVLHGFRVVFPPRHVAQILIANNGMAGTKAILSMRQWSYLELGDEKAVEFVAMATPEVRPSHCTVTYCVPQCTVRILLWFSSNHPPLLISCFFFFSSRN